MIEFRRISLRFLLLVRARPTCVCLSQLLLLSENECARLLIHLHAFAAFIARAQSARSETWRHNRYFDSLQKLWGENGQARAVLDGAAEGAGLRSVWEGGHGKKWTPATGGGVPECFSSCSLVLVLQTRPKPSIKQARGGGEEVGGQTWLHAMAICVRSRVLGSVVPLWFGFGNARRHFPGARRGLVICFLLCLQKTEQTQNSQRHGMNSCAAWCFCFGL